MDVDDECWYPLRSHMGTDDYIDSDEFILFVLDREDTVPFQTGVRDLILSTFQDLAGDKFCNQTFGDYYAQKVCGKALLPIIPNIDQGSKKVEEIYVLKVCEAAAKVIDIFETIAPSSIPSKSISSSPSSHPTISPSPSSRPSTSSSPSSLGKKPSPGEIAGPIIGYSMLGFSLSASILFAFVVIRRYNNNHRDIHEEDVAFAIPQVPSDDEAEFSLEGVGPIIHDYREDGV